MIFRSVCEESLWMFGRFYGSILFSPFAFFSMKILVFPNVQIEQIVNVNN